MTAVDEHVVPVVFLLVADKDVVVISFDHAGHLRWISLSKLNYLDTKVK